MQPKDDEARTPVPPRGRRRLFPLAVVAVGVFAATAGAGVTEVLLHGPGASTTATVPSQSPTAAAPGPSGAAGSLPAGGQGTGPVHLIVLLGKVTAVSSRSVTLAGNGPSVTAAITGSTTFAGSVHNVRQIKVGDRVMAQIQVRGSTMTVTQIQDPGTAASLP